MARRYVSREVLHQRERCPRRRYASLALRAGVPTLEGRVGRPVIWFESNPWASDGKTGRCWRSDTDYTICGVVDGVPSLLVYVTDGKVETVTFSMLLAPYQLELAVAAVRHAGLGRLVLPALTEMRRQVRHNEKETPELRAYFRRVLGTQRAAGRRRARPLPTGGTLA